MKPIRHLRALQAFDAAVIVTNHDAIDWDLVLGASRLVIDTRGIYRAAHPDLVKA